VIDKGRGGIPLIVIGPQVRSEILEVRGFVQCKEIAIGIASTNESRSAVKLLELTKVVPEILRNLKHLFAGVFLWRIDANSVDIKDVQLGLVVVDLFDGRS
jgi:hypothetical protein